MAKVKVRIGDYGVFAIDESFRDASEEERAEIIKQIIERQNFSMEAPEPIVAQTKADVIKDHGKSYIGFLPGMALGSKLAPPLGHPVATAISKGAGGLIGGIVSNEVTGPYIDKALDKGEQIMEEGKGGVLKLGDDFGQGVSNNPSVINNALVPYTTYDSSSTGVMNPNPPIIK